MSISKSQKSKSDGWGPSRQSKRRRVESTRGLVGSWIVGRFVLGSTFYFKKTSVFFTTETTTYCMTVVTAVMLLLLSLLLLAAAYWYCCGYSVRHRAQPHCRRTVTVRTAAVRVRFLVVRMYVQKHRKQCMDFDVCPEVPIMYVSHSDLRLDSRQHPISSTRIYHRESAVRESTAVYSFHAHII